MRRLGRFHPHRPSARSGQTGGLACAVGGESFKEGLKNSILQFFRRRESGAGPDSLALNQAHACLIRERAIHGA
jgi:hypothetical protein